jgi:hypothetical protein
MRRVGAPALWSLSGEYRIRRGLVKIAALQRNVQGHRFSPTIPVVIGL